MDPTSRKKRANLRDVARKAGVSVATASRVLNMPAAVSAETRDRVQSAIDDLRFVPSAAARAINSGRTRVIGALVPTLDNAIFARFLDAIENEMVQHALSVVVATTDNDPEIEVEKARNLLDIGAEGLIVSGVAHSPAFEALVQKTRIPVIATSCYEPAYALPTVGYDNRAAAQMALRHLFDLNHRRIAVLHGHAFNNDRTRARLAGLQALGLDVRLDLYEADITIEGACQAVAKILKSGAQHSAFLCLSDVLAMGALFELQRSGLSVPDEVSVMGLEDLPSSSYTTPALTSVRLQVSEMGSRAAKALASWIETSEPPEPVLLAAELIPRQSTKAVEPS